MAKERNGFITIQPEDFITIEGSPYHPPYVVGEQGDQPVPSLYRCVFIDGQPWVAFDYYMGKLHAMKEKVDQLNKGIGVPEELSGVRFAVGPNYYWSEQEGKMVRIQDNFFPFRVYINRQPPNDPNDIVQVQEVDPNYV